MTRKPIPQPLRLLATVAAMAVVALGCTVAPPDTDPPPGATGPSPGCGATTQGPVVEKRGWIGSRTYEFTVPPRHEAGTRDPVPLVLDLHGFLEGWAGTHAFATRFSALARSEGFAVAYPTGGADGIYWDVFPYEENPDLHYIDAIVEAMGERLCIDRSRVYVTGLSYGAFMTSMLMCMRPDTFAAAAPVAGMADLCATTDTPVPFVTFHGTADPILPHALFAGAAPAVAAKYGCAGQPTVTTLDPDPDPGTGGAIEKAVWDCDATGTAAESYVLHGGGHSWPGSEFFSWIAPIVGTTASSLDATEVIWQFFSEHHL